MSFREYLVRIMEFFMPIIGMIIVLYAAILYTYMWVSGHKVESGKGLLILVAAVVVIGLIINGFRVVYGWELVRQKILDSIDWYMDVGWPISLLSIFSPVIYEYVTGEEILPLLPGMIMFGCFLLLNSSLALLAIALRWNRTHKSKDH